MFFDTASDFAIADGSTCGCVGFKKIKPQRVKCRNLGFFTQLNDHWNLIPKFLLIHGWKEGVYGGWLFDGWMG